MTTKELQEKLTAKIDDLLSRNWLVKGEDRMLLEAMRRYVSQMSEVELQRLLAFLPAREPQNGDETMAKNPNEVPAELVAKFEAAVSKLPSRGGAQALDWRTWLQQLWLTAGGPAIRALIEILNKINPGPAPAPSFAMGPVDDHNHLACLQAALENSCCTCCLLSHLIEHEEEKLPK